MVVTIVFKLVKARLSRVPFRMHLLHINEFVVESYLPLPCDARCHSRAVSIASQSLLIRRSSLQDIPCLMRRIRPQLSYDVGDGVLIEPSQHLQMHVNGRGDIVTVDVGDENLALAAAWVVGAAMPVCTLFRGGLPLHGAGVEVDGRFVGIMAPSGSGKSTLLWALLEQGALFANDDCIPIALADGQVLAMPSVSCYPKLHETALANSGIDVGNCLPAPPHEDEFWVPIEASRRLREPQPLSALFVLQPLPASRQGEPDVPGGIVAERVERELAVPILLENLQGVWLLHKQLDEKNLAARCDALAQSVPLYVLKYLKRFETLPLLTNAIRDLSKNPIQGVAVFHGEEGEG